MEIYTLKIRSLHRHAASLTHSSIDNNKHVGREFNKDVFTLMSLDYKVIRGVPGSYEVKSTISLEKLKTTKDEVTLRMFTEIIRQEIEKQYPQLELI